MNVFEETGQYIHEHSGSVDEEIVLIDEILGDEPESVKHTWGWQNYIGRRSQREPEEIRNGSKHIWFVMAGRGWGKNRTAAEWIRHKVLHEGYRRVALVGKNSEDVRKLMIQGISGLLTISPIGEIAKYEPSKKRVLWANGAEASVFYGTEPNSLRGPEHDLAWCDEIASWQYPDWTFANLELGLRSGPHPLILVTGTPKPTHFVKELFKRPDVQVTRGRTIENEGNLSPVFYSRITAMYGGTRLGRQELDAELLDDNPNALWKREWIDSNRVVRPPTNGDGNGRNGHKMPDFTSVCVAIDPAVTSGDDSSDTGIVTSAKGPAMPGMKHQDLDHYYVMDDRTCHESPERWASAAVTAYHTFMADRVIGEVNNGGDLVETTIRAVDSDVSYADVRASRGKAVRAEPISALYEQGRVHHIGTFGDLEDQLCDWDPGDSSAPSPDRLDALVWGVSWLAGIGGKMLKGSDITAAGLGL